MSIRDLNPFEHVVGIEDLVDDIDLLEWCEVIIELQPNALAEFFQL